MASTDTAAEFRVLAQPSPLKEARFEFAMPVGSTVADAIVRLCDEFRVPPEMLRNAIVIIGDRAVPKPLWLDVKPRADTQCIIRALPGFAAALIPTAFALAYPTATAIIVAGLNAALTIVGSMILQSLLPAPSQSLSKSDSRAPDARYTITGVQNQLLPYGTIPKIFGRVVKYFPPLAAAPYTENTATDDQFLRVVLCVGHGPVRISDLRIGDTPIATFKNVDVEIREGYDDDAPLTLFPSEVWDETIRVPLQYVDGYTQRTTAPDVDEIWLDLEFPNGLYAQTSTGARGWVSVNCEFGYRAAGSSGAWLTPQIFAGQVGLSAPGVLTFSAKSEAAIRRSVGWSVPRGQYEVRMRRISPDDQGDHEGQFQTNTVEKLLWAAIRSQRNESPIRRRGVALIAIRAQANNQLSGTLDQVNCQVDALLPVWDGAAWSLQQTRAPAWAYAEVLRGEANARPIDDARIDGDALADWAIETEAAGIYFDGALTAQQSVWQILGDIAATGRASRAITDGRYSICRDRPQTIVRQHFTPRNSWEFGFQQTYADLPHALKVRFPNEATNGQTDEMIVYSDGYDAATASVFEVLDLPYTTGATAAFRTARRMMAAARLRPVIYSLKVDVEHIAVTRGDLVRVVHDVMLWGVGQARVKAVTLDGGGNATGVTLDAPLPMDGAKSYALRFRLSGGSSLLAPVTTVAGSSATMTFATLIAASDPMPASGDLALFGEAGEESVELIVRSIEPATDNSATVTFVDAAPEIFDADSEPLPPYDPKITLPPIVQRATPPAPVVISVTSDEGALVRASNGAWIPRIVVGYGLATSAGSVAASLLQLRFREVNPETSAGWTVIGTPPAAGSISIMPVETGSTYAIELRTVSELGLTSEWIPAGPHTVVGTSTPPPDVTRFYRRGDALDWPYADPPIDFAGFILRANYGTSTDWGTARPLHAGIVTAPPFDIGALSGVQTVLIKAVDVSGNESANAASVELNLGDPIVENAVNTYSQDPTFSGEIAGGSVSGGTLVADLASSPLYWGSDSTVAWGADAALAWPADVYGEMQYTASYTPASDELDNALLKVSLTVTGDYTVEYRIATSPTYWGSDSDPAWGSDSDPAWPDETIGDWLTFAGVLGPFSTTAETYEVRVTVRGGATQGVISDFDLIVDAPDIVERIDSFAISNTGTRLTLTQTYRAIDNVQLTVEHDGSGAIAAKYFDKQANAGANGGPLVKCYDAAGGLVSGTVSATIQGH